MARIKGTKNTKKLKSKKSASSKTKRISSMKKITKVKPSAKSKQLKPISKPRKVSKNISAINKKPKKITYNSKREKIIQKIKEDLLHQKESLLNEAELALNELPGQTVFPDLNDQATAETDRNFMLRLRGREQRLLKKIEDAIDRIDSGIFGICDDCGEKIDIKRLEARPVTTMCINCKTLQEEEEKLREL